MEHKAKEPNISFIEFIDDHYLKNIDQSDNFHKKLPFKDENHPLMIGLHYINTEAWEQVPMSQEIIEKFTTFQLSSLSLGEPSGIWQPPKSLAS